MTALAYQVVELAKAAGTRITTAESCTAGLVSAALTDVPGSSAVLDRGFVTYSNAAKTEMLGVDPALIATHGAVSEPVAHAMAAGALARSAAALSVAITGIAGPGGSEHKPEGMVCFAVASQDHIRGLTRQFGALGRTPVRVASCEQALELLYKSLQA